jgi:hypothetical protein
MSEKPSATLPGIVEKVFTSRLPVFPANLKERRSASKGPIIRKSVSRTR